FLTYASDSGIYTLSLHDALPILTDDGVDVLEEHDPWHHGVGKPGMSGFLVVLAEVSRGVEKLLWNDWRLESYFVFSIKDHFTLGPSRTVLQMQGKFKSLVSGFQTCVAALEERSHVRWYESVGKTDMSIFALD